MNETTSDNSIKEAVLETIEAGRAQPKPKWHFTLQAALGAVVLALAAAALLYLASFIFFALEETNVMLAPEFGWRGFGVFFSSLPWLLIVISLVLVFIVEGLIRRYTLGYRRPLLYTAIAIVLLAVGGSLVIARIHLHERISEVSEHTGMPMAGLYRSYAHRPIDNLYSGIITDLSRDGFFMRSGFGELLGVIVTRETVFPFGADMAPDDAVLVIGQRRADTIKADGVRCLNARSRHPDRVPPEWDGMK